MFAHGSSPVPRADNRNKAISVVISLNRNLSCLKEDKLFSEKKNALWQWQRRNRLIYQSLRSHSTSGRNVWSHFFLRKTNLKMSVCATSRFCFTPWWNNCFCNSANINLILNKQHFHYYMKQMRLRFLGCLYYFSLKFCWQYNNLFGCMSCSNWKSSFSDY